jgi:hypothetical protein
MVAVGMGAGMVWVGVAILTAFAGVCVAFWGIANEQANKSGRNIASRVRIFMLSLFIIFSGLLTSAVCHR